MTGPRYQVVIIRQEPDEGTIWLRVLYRVSRYSDLWQGTEHMLRLLVTSMETALMTIEASNVIALRVQMLCRGDLAAAREAELMVSEKLAAFTQAGTDVLFGISTDVIRKNLRSIIRANEMRLLGLRRAA
jgi:hypothetical protein